MSPPGEPPREPRAMRAGGGGGGGGGRNGKRGRKGESGGTESELSGFAAVMGDGKQGGEGWLGGWSEQQLGLLDVLVRVVRRVGEEGAAEIRQSRNPDGAAFVRELSLLRERARMADMLEEELGRNKVQQESMKKMQEVNADGTMKTAKNMIEGEGDAHADLEGESNSNKILTRDGADRLLNKHFEEKGKTLRSSGMQTDLILVGDGITEGGGYKTLINKYNVLHKNHQELSAARQALENRLREKARNERAWIDYARVLEKQKANMVAFLKSRDISTEELCSSIDPPKAPSTSFSNSLGISSSNSTGPEKDLMTDKSPTSSFGMLGTPRNSNKLLLRGQTSCRDHHPEPSEPLVEQQFEDPNESNNDVPILKKLWGHLDGNDRKLDAEACITKSNDAHRKKKPTAGEEYPMMPQFFHSSSTQADLDTNLVVTYVEQNLTSPVLVKTESPSDTPVVVSSRSVRKRRRHDDAELDDDVKVKVELISSSPVGIVGFQHLFSQESMDLDNIGEKIDTPKKKRQFVQTPRSLDNRKLGLPDSRPAGKTSALQPVSPNKQILPRTSNKEPQWKRHRIGDSMIGARILAEDTDNESTLWDSDSTKPQKEKSRLSLSTYTPEVDRHLTGLLEEPSPQRIVLTTKSASVTSITADQCVAGFVGQQKLLPPAERRTISILRQPGTPATPNPQNLTPSNASNGSKVKSGRRPAVRNPQDITTFDPNSPHHKPFRMRSVRDLGLSHFKVNPDFNQGYDYAFTDVVRGREQRKCLSGCTKPECCGEKFRKLVEMISRPDELQTESQEHADEKLLEEYLGDNYYRLRTMSRSERNELLIQAKAKDLAQKAGKHRHAYERRRSPPGFWRTDFPSTQELEEDRREAARVERELVQQRYDEAMRPGGRWMFRDE